MDQDQSVVSAVQEVVVIRLGGERYALPMSAVAEVGRPPALTRVPGLPTWSAGVANWRGRVLAVVDLRPLLDSAPAALDRHSRLVVIRRDGVSVGVLSEGVEGTRLLDGDQIEPVLTHLPGSAASLLLGQATDAAGPCGVLDLDAVFALPDSLPRARRAS